MKICGVMSLRIYAGITSVSTLSPMHLGGRKEGEKNEEEEEDDGLIQV